MKFFVEPEYFKTMAAKQYETFEELKQAIKMLHESNFTEAQLWAYDKYLDNIRTQYAIDEYNRERAEKALAEGLSKGMQQGMQQGIQQGIEQGIEQGIQQGIQQGIEQGLEKGKELGFQLSLDILADLNAGMLSNAALAQKYQIPIDQILELQIRMSKISK